MGEDRGGKGEKIFRNKYKAHMDKTKGGVGSGVGGRDGWGNGGNCTWTTIKKKVWQTLGPHPGP